MSKARLGLILAIVALVFITMVMPDLPGLPAAGKMALGVAVFAIIVWVTQAVDDALSGLIIVFLLAALKATSVNGAFSGYANTSLWLIVVGFIMAAAMERSGLSKRIALHLVSLAGGSASKIYWAIAGVMAIMTFLVPSITARTLLMLPIVLGIGQAFDAKPGQSNIVKALLFIVAMSGTAMSIGVLTAHVGNPITAGLIQQATKQTISWAQWLVIGGPPAFILGFLSVFLLKILWPPEISNLGEGQNYVTEELAKLGKVSSLERYTMVVFLLTLVLWATDSYHKIPVIIVGILSVIFLLWPGIGVMNWKEAQSKVPWNVFILYGSGLSMGTALATSGAAKWLAGTFLKPVAAMDQTIQIIILIWLITALQVLFTGGGPKTTALTPVVIAHAVAIGANPLVFALVLGMNMHHQYLLPVSNMPNAVICGTPHIKSSELMRTGAVMSVFAAVFFSIVVFTYWQWIGVLQ